MFTIGRSESRRCSMWLFVNAVRFQRTYSGSLMAHSRQERKIVHFAEAILAAVLGVVRRGLDRAGEWAYELFERSRMCRECSQSVSPMHKVCWNCGIANPVRIPFKDCAILFGAPVLLTVAYLWLA